LIWLLVFLHRMLICRPAFRAGRRFCFSCGGSLRGFNQKVDVSDCLLGIDQRLERADCGHVVGAGCGPRFGGVPAACTHPKRTTKTLEAAGYRSVEITGWRPFMKSDSDWFSTGFRAIGPNGQEVTGAVTGGLVFKGNTIRTD